MDGWIVGGRSSCKKGAYITLLLGRNGVSEESEEPSLEDESVDSVGIGIGWFADLFVFFGVGGWKWQENLEMNMTCGAFELRKGF